jgi:hypothetical protein
MKLFFLILAITFVSAELPAEKRVNVVDAHRMENLLAEWWYTLNNCFALRGAEQANCVYKTVSELTTEDVVYFNPNVVNYGARVGQSQLIPFFQAVAGAIANRVQVVGPSYTCKDGNYFWIVHEEFVRANSTIYPRQFLGIQEFRTSNEYNRKYYGFKKEGSELKIAAIVQPDQGHIMIYEPVVIDGVTYHIEREVLDWEDYLDFDYRSCDFAFFYQMLDSL